MVGLMEGRMIKQGSLLSKNVINQSGIEFGTSGARGLVTDFTPEVCFAFTCAIDPAVMTWRWPVQRH